MQRKLHGIGSLPFNVEQNLRRRWERFTWRIADHANRKQRNTVLGAAARNELRLHINRGCARGLRDFLSLVDGIDYRRHRQKIRAMDERTAKARMHLAWLNGREIFRKQEITGVQFIIKRACKTGANQTIELSILKEARHPLTACFFANAGMENLNRAIVDLAANCFDALAITLGFIAEATQECRAFRWQSKRDRNHQLICLQQRFSINLVLPLLRRSAQRSSFSRL